MFIIANWQLTSRRVLRVHRFIFLVFCKKWWTSVQAAYRQNISRVTQYQTIASSFRIDRWLLDPPCARFRMLMTSPRRWIKFTWATAVQSLTLFSMNLRKPFGSMCSDLSHQASAFESPTATIVDTVRFSPRSPLFHFSNIGEFSIVDTLG